MQQQENGNAKEADLASITGREKQFAEGGDCKVAYLSPRAVMLPPPGISRADASIICGNPAAVAADRRAHLRSALVSLGAPEREASPSRILHERDIGWNFLLKSGDIRSHTGYHRLLSIATARRKRIDEIFLVRRSSVDRG